MDKAVLIGMDGDAWAEAEMLYKQTNQHGVECSLRPSMNGEILNWETWWRIPLGCLEVSEEWVAGQLAYASMKSP